MKPFFLAMFMMMNLAYATNEQKTEPDIVGYWQGKAYTKQEETLVAIAIEQAPNSEKKTARLYLPEVGVSGWPATYVGITAANIVLHFPSDSGVQVMTLSMVNQDLTGTWSEGRFSEPARVKLRKQEFIQKSLTQNLSILGSAGN